MFSIKKIYNKLWNNKETCPCLENTLSLKPERWFQQWKARLPNCIVMIASVLCIRWSGSWKAHVSGPCLLSRLFCVRALLWHNCYDKVWCILQALQLLNCLRQKNEGLQAHLRLSTGVSGPNNIMKERLSFCRHLLSLLLLDLMGSAMCEIEINVVTTADW